MNGNRFVLDTNIALCLLGGDFTLGDFLYEKRIYISIITELELIGFPDITLKEMSSLKSLIDTFSIIDLNEDIKVIYSDLRKKYRLKLGDAAAAATAIYLDLPFMSADKDFKKVTELNFAYYSK